MVSSKSFLSCTNFNCYKDLYGNNTERMWELISECDVNKNWSASIVQNKGKLRGYFARLPHHLIWQGMRIMVLK